GGHGPRQGRARDDSQGSRHVHREERGARLGRTVHRRLRDRLLLRRPRDPGTLKSMRDYRRLLLYVRPYLGRLVAAVVCSLLLSVVYLGLLGLIQPLLELMFPGASTLAIAGGGKVRLFDAFRKALGAGDAAQPGWTVGRLLGGGAAGTIALVAVFIVVLFVLKGIFTYLTSYFTR